MSLPVLILFIGSAYIVLIGILSLLKREELSTQFAIEAIVITFIFCGLTAYTRLAIHPVLFLLIVYFITMRVPLLVDIGTIFAKRKQFPLAEKFFSFALQLWPDRSNTWIVRINQGVAYFQQGDFDKAIHVYQEILQSIDHCRVSAKLEAAAHYNLGVAYLRQNKDAQATVEFNIVVDSWPATEYARRASDNLEKHRRKNIPSDQM
ncbi:MAG: tetratricopeptide repeat protein [Anaerolineales bacterium]|nr:tetratricopeptide repeat protein [Anaerolineales bacterium]